MFDRSKLTRATVIPLSSLLLAVSPARRNRDVERASGSRVPTLMASALANAAINFRIDNQALTFNPHVRARLREEADAIKREIAFPLGTILA